VRAREVYFIDAPHKEHTLPVVLSKEKIVALFRCKDNHKRALSATKAVKQREYTHINTKGFDLFKSLSITLDIKKDLSRFVASLTMKAIVWCILFDRKALNADSVAYGQVECYA